MFSRLTPLIRHQDSSFKAIIAEKWTLIIQMLHFQGRLGESSSLENVARAVPTISYSFGNHPVSSQAMKQHTIQLMTPAPITSAQLAKQSMNIIMVASIHEVPSEPPLRAPIFTHTSTFCLNETDSHTWLIESATSSHLSGKQELFTSLHDIPPVTIETASSNTFTANQ